MGPDFSHVDVYILGIISACMTGDGMLNLAKVIIQVSCVGS